MYFNPCSCQLAASDLGWIFFFFYHIFSIFRHAEQTGKTCRQVKNQSDTHQRWFMSAVTSSATYKWSGLHLQTCYILAHQQMSVKVLIQLLFFHFITHVVLHLDHKAWFYKDICFFFLSIRNFCNCFIYFKSIQYSWIGHYSIFNGCICPNWKTIVWIPRKAIKIQQVGHNFP